MDVSLSGQAFLRRGQGIRAPGSVKSFPGWCPTKTRNPLIFGSPSDSGDLPLSPAPSPERIPSENGEPPRADRLREAPGPFPQDSEEGPCPCPAPRGKDPQDPERESPLVRSGIEGERTPRRVSWDQLSDPPAGERRSFPVPCQQPEKSRQDKEGRRGLRCRGDRTGEARVNGPSRRGVKTFCNKWIHDSAFS